MGLRLCKMSFRSLRDLFLLLILIAVLSSMMTFHMSSYLPWLQPQPEFKIHVDGHLNIYRSLQLNRKTDDGNKHRGLFRGGRRMSEEQRALFTALQKLEEQSLPLRKSPLVIIAEGSLSAIKHELPLLESAFSRLGAKVKFKVSGDIVEDPDQLKQNAYDTNKPTWRVLMCLNTSRPNTCRDTGQNLDLEHFQKANVIPGLHSLLFDPQLMCQGVGNTGRWQGGPLPCYKLLEQTSAVSSSKTDRSVVRCENLTMWILHAGQHQGKAELKKCEEWKELWNRDGRSGDVAVRLPPFLFHMGSQPLVIQFHVLVMSFSPLRLYLHSEGLSWEGISPYLNKKPQRSMTVSELQQLITEVQEQSASVSAISNLEEAIVSAMLQLELVTSHRNWEDDYQSSCPTCFQLLEVTTVFNTTFHPFILQIKPYTHSDKLASLNEYLVRQRILEDLATMLVAKDTVVKDVARGLGELGLTTIYNEGVCNSDQSFCLSKEDLVYSLNNRREQLHKGNFIKLYPSTTAVKYTQLLQSVQDKDEDIDGDQHTSTSELHSFLLSLESYYAHMEEEDSIEAYDDVNVPIDFDGTSNVKPAPRSTNNTEVQSKRACSDDPASMPYLMNIITKPLVKLVPEFSPFTTEYHAVVNYEMLLITVWAFAKSCSSQARLEDKHGNNREVNFTLGIGENRISIFVVDMSHADPWVLNTYTLLIQRQGPDYQQTSFLPGIPHRICSLKQDCSLKFLKTSSCGLHPVEQEKNWVKFVERKMSLPQCPSGDITGQWFVPCTDCNDSPSCYWQQALWQPNKCSYKWLPRGKVQQCFAGKKVLFIGDSTNRGILHYITEQVNGTLLEWDKTHHLKVYTNLNNNNTIFSFAYYPQFWLPTEHRPVFDKALYQLIKKNIPLENNTNTVLVIGGVHWLGKHHIDVVLKALKREGLTGIQLLVKGLGAGFHQPVSGVHCLSQKDHQRLVSHNQAVLTYAKQNGFNIVDTFNMTMARYKDFLQGKCACHFHRVTMTKTSYKPSKTNGGKHSVSKSQRAVYHVEGEINAVYSEMMISQICRAS